MSKPPLESDEKAEIDPATGTRLRRTFHKRGRLEQVDLHYESFDAGLLALSNVDPVNKFESLRNRARAVLRAADLPADDGGVSVVKGRARAAETTVQQITAGFRIKAWSKIVEERSEPLSRERSAMLLIKSINRILESDLDKKTLEHIWSVVQSAHRFEMALGINEAAASGDKGNKDRALGPSARTAARNQKLEIARELVCKFWKNNPLQRGKIDPTVREISDEFNARVRNLGLQPITSGQLRNYVRQIRDSEDF